MLDINTNLEELFCSYHFYKIIADKDGRTVLYGALEDLKPLRTGETLESALNFIRKTSATHGYSPILIYPIGYDHTKDAPYCAINKKNKLSNGMYFFKKSYYLSEDVHPLAAEILNAYLSDYDKVEPEKINFGNLDKSYAKPYMVDHQKFLEQITGTKNYYAISDFFIAKEEKGELRATPMDVYISYNLQLILQDQKHEETYDYPIVIFQVVDNNTLLEPKFMINNEDEEPFIMEFVKGYYTIPVDKTFTIERLIDTIHEHEIKAFTRPQKPTIKIKSRDGLIEKPNPDYMKIPS